MSSPGNLLQTGSGANRIENIDIAGYYYRTRARIHEDLPVLRSLMDAVNWQNDLTPAQWTQWYSVALGFEPDLIVELGRGHGNSTAVFCQAASRLEHTHVLSLCNSTVWNELTVPRLKPVVPAGWFDALDARVVDILDVDYEPLLRGAERVLLLWDAHGFEIAETVLGQILPLLVGRDHLVLMHDITDTRYAAVSRSYEGQPIWKGSTFVNRLGQSSARVHIGWMSSLQDQVVAIADFGARNDVEIRSADHEYATFFAARPAAAREMARLLGNTMFSISAHWAFFSLAGKQPPLHFPAVQHRFRHSCGVAIRDLHPARWFKRWRALPRVIETGGVPWQYAAVMRVRPLDSIPAAARPSLRIRARVESAPVGIGLLNPDQSVFVQVRRVQPSLEPQTVWLELGDPEHAGPLVVHAWDTTEPARVRLEEISVVW